MSAVKVRGIYSSAITNLLTKNKLKIAQPSNNIQETFPKLKFKEEYSTLIYDFSDKGGVIIKGDETEKVCKIFQKLPQVIVQTESSGHIYLGKIIKLDPNTKNIHVDLGFKKPGLLPLKDYWGYVKEGEKILVQLKDEEKDNFLLSTKIHLFGKNLILIQKGFTKISKHVRDKKTIDKLNKIVEDECKEGWGILWKTSAKDKSEKDLKKEIKGLYSDFEKIQKNFEKEEKIKILSTGIITCYVRFSKETKIELDKLRREVKPTIKSHHDLKTDIFANIVDFSENLIKKKLNEKKINKGVKEFVKSKSSREGDVFLISEHKLNGSTKFLKGRLVEKDEDSLSLKRFLKSGKEHEILDLRVEHGDYIITSAKEGDSYLKHEYYDKKDELKKEFYTINTPIEIHSNRLITNSLALIVIKNDKGSEMVNNDLLEEYEKEKVISKELKKLAEKTAKKLISKGDKK